MNKKLIAAAVSAAVMAPVAAQAEVSVYGRINNAIDMNDISGADDADSTTDISTVSSRFGIKYNQEIGSGYSAHGKYEFSTTTDKEGKRSFERSDSSSNDTAGVDDVRVATVGLSGPFGRIDIGNQWSAYYDTFGTLVDPTYTLGYYLYSSVGGAPYRASNTIKYSNSFGPLYAELDVRLNESDESADNAEKIRGDGIGLGLSWAITDNITIAAAWDSEDGVDDNTGYVAATAPVTGVSPGDLSALTGTTAAEDAAYAAITNSDAAVLADLRNRHIADLLATEEAAADREGRAARFDTDTTFTGYTAAMNGNPAHSTNNDSPDTDRFGIGVRLTYGGYWINIGTQSYEVDDDENTPGDDEVDVDTTFIYGGGSFSETTNWMLGVAEADDARDAVARVIPNPAAGAGFAYGVDAADETDDSSHFLWGVYHNLGGGIKIFWEGVDLDSENKNWDGARHLLGMRVDF